MIDGTSKKWTEQATSKTHGHIFRQSADAALVQVTKWSPNAEWSNDDDVNKMFATVRFQRN